MGPPSSRPKWNIGVRRLRFATFDAILAVPANNRSQVPSRTNSTPSLAPEAPTEATIEAVPDPAESIPEVALEPPQENGYRSLLPEDEIPNLQTALASCGQLMISLR